MSVSNASGSGRVLIVDDDPIVRDTAREVLRPLVAEVVTAATGEDALREVADNPPDIVLLDVVMPGISGYEVCRRLKWDPKTNGIPVIIMTGLDAVGDHVDAIESGADDFVSKPFAPAVLQARVKTFIQAKRTRDELTDYRKHLEKKVREQMQVIREVQDATVLALASLAESRDPETGEHLERIRYYSQLIARSLASSSPYADQIDEQFIESVFRSSVLHDVGKVAILDSILRKPGKLTPEEFEIMKTHTTIGGDALDKPRKRIPTEPFLDMACVIAYYHHDKFDGSGYPFGARGQDIPLAARIVAVADVFDALLTRRPYKDPFTLDKTIETMIRGRGSHFDPVILDAFLENIAEAERIAGSYPDPSGQQAPVL